jgi:hypothetical protein
MDDWSFISLAKAKSDLGLFGTGAPLAKAETALALDYHAALEKQSVRGILAFATASLVNAAFFGAIESSALDARTPNGEVIVAEVVLDEPALQRTASL